MVLPSSGTLIKFSDLQNEFGGSHPIALSEYYSVPGSFTSNVAGVPNSGTLFLSSTFGGKSQIAIVLTNLVQNPNFTSTASWTSSAGWGSTATNDQLYANSAPSIKTNDPGMFASYVMFSYASTPHTITQTIALSTPKSSYTFSYYVSTNFNGSVVDKYYAKATFRNASNAVQFGSGNGEP